MDGVVEYFLAAVRPHTIDTDEWHAVIIIENLVPTQRFVRVVRLSFAHASVSDAHRTPFEHDYHCWVDTLCQPRTSTGVRDVNQRRHAVG